MTTNPVASLQSVQQECLELFRRKNADYGNAFAEYGTIGVLVRMGDKIKRAMTITNNGINVVNGEGLRDTLVDLCNYSAMAVMLMDEGMTPVIDFNNLSQAHHIIPATHVCIACQGAKPLSQMVKCHVDGCAQVVTCRECFSKQTVGEGAVKCSCGAAICDDHDNGTGLCYEAK